MGMEQSFETLQSENYALRECVIHLQSRLLDAQGEFPKPPPNVNLSQPPSASVPPTSSPENVSSSTGVGNPLHMWGSSDEIALGGYLEYTAVSSWHDDQDLSRSFQPPPGLPLSSSTVSDQPLIPSKTNMAFEPIIKQLASLRYVDSPYTKVNIGMNGNIIKGFKHDENKGWYTMKKNYFAIRVHIDRCELSRPMVYISDSGETLQVSALFISVDAVDPTTNQDYEVKQYTAKREKGPITKAEWVLHNHNAQPVFAYDRLQFNKATANNSANFRNRNHFRVRVKLEANVLKQDECEGGRIEVCSMKSPDVIVLSRSTRYYTKRAKHVRD
jgi:hypothetical protein